jgi:hypothetical protein
MRRGRPPSFGPSPAGYGAAALEATCRSEINGALFRKLHEPLTIEPLDIGDPGAARCRSPAAIFAPESS